MSECVFCRPGETVYRLAPLNPVTPGHMLFIPGLHVRDAGTSPWVTGGVFTCAAEYAAEQHRPFNLITSAGSPATQSVFHLHVHYVPRDTDDGLRLPWSDG